LDLRNIRHREGEWVASPNWGGLHFSLEQRGTSSGGEGRPEETGPGSREFLRDAGKQPSKTARGVGEPKGLKKNWREGNVVLPGKTGEGDSISRRADRNSESQLLAIKMSRTCAPERERGRSGDVD